MDESTNKITKNALNSHWASKKKNPSKSNVSESKLERHQDGLELLLNNEIVQLEF